MRLTNFKIKSAGIGQRLHDGRGLYLTLSAPKKVKWTIRYMLSRKAKEMGLGDILRFVFLKHANVISRHG